MLQINEKVYRLAYELGFTKNTLMLFFELVMACDTRGCTEFNCVDLAKSTGLSHMSVYRGLRELEELEMLSVDKISGGKRVRIFGNSYENGDMKKFVNMNVRFFTERCYKELTYPETVTFLFYYWLYLVRKARNTADDIKIKPGLGPFCKAISLHTGISEESARKSVKGLIKKGFFEENSLSKQQKILYETKCSHYICINKRYIKRADHNGKGGNDKGIKADKNGYHHIATVHNIAAVRFECHKMKMDIDEKTAYDCGEVVNLYYKRSKKFGKNIYTLIHKTLATIKGMKDAVFTGALFNTIFEKTMKSTKEWQCS